MRLPLPTPAAGETRPPVGLLPAGRRIYAIGDIHGRHDLLTALLAAIGADLAETPCARPLVVFLGDYVSRGPDSCRVVDTVLGWRPPGVEVVTLKGNHEDLLLQFLAGDFSRTLDWFAHGGRAVLASYGIVAQDTLARLREAFAAAMPAAHHRFLAGLGVHYDEGGYRFVHAGVAPGVPLAEQSAHDQLWLRRPFLDCREDFGAVIVHGHSIAATPQLHRNRIGVDTGAYHSGLLTCLVIEADGYAFLQT